MKRKFITKYLIPFLLFLLIIILIIFFRKCAQPKDAYVLEESDLPTKQIEMPVLHPDQKIVKSLPLIRRVPKPEIDIDFLATPPILNEKPVNVLQRSDDRIFGLTPINDYQEPQMVFERPGNLRLFSNQLVIGAQDLYSVVQKPLHWESSDFAKLAYISLGTFLLTRVDDKIDEHVKANLSFADNILFDAAEIYGRNTTVLYSALGFNLLGFAANDSELKLIGLELIESYLIAENLSNLLKFSFGRSRPFLNRGANDFNLFNPLDQTQRALPSGHSAMAFTLSTVLANHVDNTYLKILIYTPAFLTAAQRLYNNQHWLSDIFLGAALGYFVGNAVTSLHDYDSKNNVLVGFNEKGELNFVIPFN